MTAHAFGRHVAHSSPLVRVTVKAIGGGGGEFGVASHDENLAPQHGGRSVAPGLRAFGRNGPAVSHRVVALDLTQKDALN